MLGQFELNFADYLKSIAGQPLTVGANGEVLYSASSVNVYVKATVNNESSSNLKGLDLKAHAATRVQLDAAICSRPGCNCGNEGPIHLSLKCHPEAPLEVFYFDGLLHVACTKCAELHHVIKVADK